jgi:hypothetical protein
MSYLHIENLYKTQEILLFKECYAMEKIHGTSAHISYKDGKLSFFSGGAKYESFVALFNQEDLNKNFIEKAMGLPVTIYGEAYGGKEQGMGATYGKDLKFIVFEVKIGDCWLNVLKAHNFADSMGLEFVHYQQITTDLASIDKEMLADSVQAIRNGMGSHRREGIVLRPIEEFTMNNGSRVIVKHKRDEFKETSTPRKIDGEKLKVITEAREIATEWVTNERLNHVLTGNNIEMDITNTGKVIALMIEDIEREAKGEITPSSESKKAISKETALLFKRKLSVIEL